MNFKLGDLRHSAVYRLLFPNFGKRFACLGGESFFRNSPQHPSYFPGRKKILQRPVNTALGTF